MSIRILRSLFQNSKLNREKFINNKKIYKVSTLKNRQQNYNKTITRRMSSYKPPLSFGNGPNGPHFPNGGSIIYMILAAVGFNISVNITKSNGKEQ